MEKSMATHSCILAWRISWTEELGGLQSTASQRARHDWETKHIEELSLKLFGQILEAISTAEYSHDFYNSSPKEYVKMVFKKLFRFYFFLWIGQQVRRMQESKVQKDICENHL